METELTTKLRELHGRLNIAAHRIAWEMVNGPIPLKAEIDHRDGDATNNRLSNLRLATRNQNMFNRPCSITNTSGRKGVKRVGTKFQATISAYGQTVNLGRHETEELAAEAYDKKALELHGEFAHCSSKGEQDKG